MMGKTVWLSVMCVVGSVAIAACGSSNGTGGSTEGTGDTGTGGNTATSSSSGTGGTMSTSSSSSTSSTSSSTSASSSSGTALVNGCDPATAENHTTNATVTIDFGGAAGLAYKPPCIKIATGTVVTFAGAFTSHPLAGGMAGTLDATSPIKETLVGTSAMFTFATAGTFPYYCEDHFASGMQGAIFVQ
jgi:plastocyanin